MDEIDDTRRRILIHALTAGSLIGLFKSQLVSAESLFGATPREMPEDQSVYRVRGMVHVNGKRATEKTRIAPGDTIETGQSGQLIFKLGSHALLLHTLTNIAIAPNDSPVISTLSITNGRVLSVSSHSKMRIKMPVAHIGVRGTGWYAEADLDRSYFCTCYGITDVSATNDPTSKTSITSQHHDKPVYILKEAASGQSIVDAPFINHTDEELTLIEAIVGRTPPFIFPIGDYAGPRREY